MTTWAQLLAAAERDVVWWVEIEGVGPYLSAADLAAASADGRYRFGSRAPMFATSEPAGLWREVMASPPDILSERLSELGGVAELGGLTVSVVDIDDVLSSAFATDRPPVATLSADLTAASGTLSVRGAGAVPANAVLHINEEAVYLRSAPSTSMAIERAGLGTAAQPHAADDAVYDASSFLAGRRIDLYAAAYGAQTFSDAVLVGSHVIESLSWDDTVNVWNLNCRSELGAFEQLSPSEPRASLASEVLEALSGDGRAGAGIITSHPVLAPLVNHWSSVPKAYVAVGDEVVAGEVLFPGWWATSSRGVCETETDDPEASDELRQVMTSSRLGSSFRYSPGPNPSTDRSSGTWVETRHPLRILLCILLSSRTADDGLELTNFTGGQANYSSLPSGFGGGFEAGVIDWDAWNDVIARTASFELPNVVFGNEEKTLREWVDEWLLRPLNVSVVSQFGVISVVRPRIPLAAESVAVLGMSQIHTTPADVGQPVRPEMTLSRTLQVPDEFGFTLGPAATSTGVAKAVRSGPAAEGVVLEVKGAATTSAAFWALEALERVRRVYRPRTRLECVADASLWDARLGEFVRVVLPDVPNFVGDRGIDAPGWVREREVILDAEGGLALRLVVDIFSTQETIYRIGPAARVIGVSGNNATVALNAFTSASSTGGLPTRDADAFSAGDVVMLRSRSGVPFAGTQTVVSASVDTVVLDGNFSGNLAVNTFVVIAPYASASATQRARYAFMADDSLLVSGDAPYLYGES